MATPLGFLTMCARMGMPDAKSALAKYKAERATLAAYKGAACWVATYGDGGLDVSFYPKGKEYEAAEAEAESEHDRGEFDSYTCGHTISEAIATKKVTK